MVALTTTKIIGSVLLPDGAVAEKSFVHFHLDGHDTDVIDNVVLSPDAINSYLDVNGNLDVDLWPNSRGVRDTMYAVKVGFSIGIEVIEYDLGKIVVPAVGPVDLNDLLPLMPADVEDIYAAAGFSPEIAYDFSSTIGGYGTGYFRKGGAQVVFDSLMLHTATSDGTVTDSDGLLKHRAHNLLRFSEDMTQPIWGASGVTKVSFNNVTYIGGQGEPHKKRLELATLGVGTASKPFTVAVIVSGAGKFRLKNTHAGVLENYSSDFTATSTPTLYEFEVDNSSSAGSSVQVGGIVGATTDDAFDLTVTAFHLYRSDLGGMQDNPDNTTVGLESYVPTTSAPVYKRRNNYVFDGADWIGPKCLVEPAAATNLVTFSSEFDNAAWVKTSLTVSADTTTAPDGEAASDKLVEGSGTITPKMEQSESLFSGDKYVISAYLKAAERSTLQFNYSGLPQAHFDLSSGISTDAVDNGFFTNHVTTMKAVGDGWFLCAVSFDCIQNKAGQIRFYPNQANATSISSYTGDGVSGLYIYGAQLEVGSVPSSYIPTAAATATRDAETLVIPAANLASVVNTTAMSISLKGDMSYADTDLPTVGKFYRWHVDASNSISVDNQTVGASSGGPYFSQEAANVVDFVLGSGGYWSPEINVPFNIASRHGSTFINGALDGVALTENTTPTSLADLSTADFQIAETGIHNIEQGRIWGVDITDTGTEDASS